MPVRTKCCYYFDDMKGFNILGDTSEQRLACEYEFTDGSTPSGWLCRSFHAFFERSFCGHNVWAAKYELHLPHTMET